MFHIRSAHHADAAALSAIAEQTFRSAFASVNTAEDMAQHCRTSYGAEIQTAEIANPALSTLLCEADGALIGFAQLRWGQVPACVGATLAGEIQRLYVADAWHGMGVAQVLMRACIDAIGARGAEAVWLGVWEHNPRAIAFYRKHGFVEVGEHSFLLGSDRQRDIVMVKPLHRGASGAEGASTVVS